MALGSALTTKIEIDFIRAQGQPSRGRIWFQPFRQPVGPSMLSDVAVPADVISGRGSIDLVRLPVGSYRVVEQIDGRPDRVYEFALPVTSLDVVQYESIMPLVSPPVKHQYVSKINGVSPNPTTGNIEIAAIEGPAGPKGDDGTDGSDGVNGTNGTNGTDGRDGVLKAFGTTGMITGTFGPAGDAGDWDYCPASYRPKCVAAVGDRILWTPGFLHKFDQEAVCDLAAMIDGAPVRFRSSGTAVPLSSGYGGLYMHATFGGLRPVWWTVAEDDISLEGEVTLALAFRNNGSGNMMGHASIAGDISLANAGPGGVL